MYKTVSKLVPEDDGCHCVVVPPSVVDNTIEGLELLLLGILDLAHAIIGNVVADNVLDECPIEVSGAHMLADLLDS